MISKEEIKKKAKKVSNSLYRLEKAGVQNESAMYRTIERYAIDKNSKYYNVNLEKGTIRPTRNLENMTREELYRYNEILDNILESETRTVSGTRKAIKKGYETFLNSTAHASAPDLTYDKYREIFKIYRTQVADDKKSHFGSQVVLDLIENTDIYTLTADQLADAFTYASEQGVDEMLDNYFTETDERWEFNE